MITTEENPRTADPFSQKPGFSTKPVFPQSSELLQRSGRTRALIVEDEGLNVLFLTKALKLKGYQIAGTAKTGEKALEQVRLVRPDFILMDVNLPGMDGLEATRRIMADYPIPILILTAYSRDTFYAEALEAGASGYVVKPITSEGLDTEIQQAFERFETKNCCLR